MKLSKTTVGFGNAGELTKALQPWQGGRAQILECTASHNLLAIWVTKPPSDWVVGDCRPGGVLIQCARCVSVRFVPVWGPMNMGVTGLARDGNRESLRLSDGISFDVTCWDAQVTGVFEDFNEMCRWKTDG